MGLRNLTMIVLFEQKRQFPGLPQATITLWLSRELKIRYSFVTRQDPKKPYFRYLQSMIIHFK